MQISEPPAPGSSKPPSAHKRTGQLIVRRIVRRQEITKDIVKSAGRTLQILEYFDSIQRPANVVEISTQLGFPQSSSSVLLRSLVKMGYLDYESRERTYVSTVRVALLGSWINSSCLAEGDILQAMRFLSHETGDAIVLAARNGLYGQYIHVIQAANVARLHVAVGTIRPLAASATGYAMLALLDDREVSKIVRRINADAIDPADIVNTKELLETLADIRKSGYAFESNLVTPGGAMMISPIPARGGATQMFLGLAGISQVMEQRREELAGHLRAAVMNFFGSPPERVYEEILLRRASLAGPHPSTVSHM